ncbi:hypothetical protein MKZ38_004202 [Zalerion maritima]|uniref:Uncharacterized protein n=1 Tax=Zalerion maritima TaxID=339359 RepID=A0AAD5RLV3_9PEZI|nr:hypothetical protein MKZ38_004202 [Zalerion maritima]
MLAGSSGLGGRKMSLQAQHLALQRAALWILRIAAGRRSGDFRNYRRLYSGTQFILYGDTHHRLTIRTASAAVHCRVVVTFKAPGSRL